MKNMLHNVNKINFSFEYLLLKMFLKLLIEKSSKNIDRCTDSIGKSAPPVNLTSGKISTVPTTITIP